MAYVITEPCVGVCDTACVEVCPKDCIHPTKDAWGKLGWNKDSLEGKQLFIDPEECIDCAACEPMCPVEAIFIEDEVPAGQERFIQINADYYKHQIR